MSLLLRRSTALEFQGPHPVGSLGSEDLNEDALSAICQHVSHWISAGFVARERWDCRTVRIPVKVGPGKKASGCFTGSRI